MIVIGRMGGQIALYHLRNGTEHVHISVSVKLQLQCIQTTTTKAEWAQIFLQQTSSIKLTHTEGGLGPGVKRF